MLDSGHLVMLSREALKLVLLVSAPPLLVALVVGLVSGILQAATQVQDQALSNVPKFVLSMIATAISAPWIGAQVLRFARLCIDLIPRLAG